METPEVETTTTTTTTTDNLTTPSTVLNNLNQQSQSQEENTLIENEDEFAGIEDLNQEELIDIIKEIREEFFALKGKYRNQKKSIVDRQKEVDFLRNLLAEREDLLLQLQWDPSQDKSYVQDEDEVRQQRTQAMLNQMRIMENGIFERDEKIKTMEKALENLIVNQVNAGSLPSDYSLNIINNNNSNIEMNSMNQQQPASTSASSTPVNLSPNTAAPTKRISEYPLNYKPKDVVDVYTPQFNLPNNGLAPQRSPSFWNSPSGFLSYWIGWDTPTQPNEESDNNTQSSSSNMKSFDENVDLGGIKYSPSSSNPAEIKNIQLK